MLYHLRHSLCAILHRHIFAADKCESEFAPLVGRLFMFLQAYPMFTSPMHVLAGLTQ